MSIVSDILKHFNNGKQNLSMPTITNGAVGKLSNFLISYAEQLTSNIALKESIIKIFSSNVDLVSDKIVDADSSNGYITFINDLDIAKGLDDLVSTVMPNDTDAIYLTDIEGNVYQITHSGTTLNYRNDSGSYFLGAYNATNGSVTLNNVIGDSTGGYSSFWDLILDLKESVALDSAMSSCCELILSGTEDLPGLYASLSNLRSTVGYDSAVQFIDDVTQSFSIGGVYGAVSCLVGYAKTASSATMDEGGRLIFTDNTTYTPKAFGVGAIAAIADIAATLASAVVAVFSPIVAMAGYAIYSAIKQVGTAINYAYDTETRTSLCDSLNMGKLMAPYAVVQGSYYVDYSSPIWPLFAKFADGGPNSIRFPGGYLIFTLVSYQDTDEQIYYVLDYEIHPDLVDRTTWCQNRLAWLTGQTVYDSDGTTVIDTNRSGTAIRIRDPYWFIQSAMEIEFEDVVEVNIQNQSNGFLSDADALYVSKIVYANATIAALAVYFANCDEIGHSAVDKWIFIDVTNNPSHIVNNSYASYACEGDSSGQRTSNWIVTRKTTIDPQGVVGATIENSAMSALLGLAYIYRAYVLGSLVPFGDSSSIWMYLGICCNSMCTLVNSRFDYSLTDFTTNSFSITNAFSIEFGLGLCEYNRVPTKLIWAVKTPKYSRESFWGAFAGQLVAIALLSAATVLISIKARNEILYRRAKNVANVEATWSRFINDPTKANYKAYRKAAKKNNFLANLFGGQKVSLSGFWNAEQSTTSSAPRNRLLNAIDSSVGGSEVADTANAVQSKVVELGKRITEDFN